MYQVEDEPVERLYLYVVRDDEQPPSFLPIDNDETYRLFISLHEQFKQQQAPGPAEDDQRGRGCNSCS